MTNHPGRPKAFTAVATPTPAEVRALRESYRLSTEQAGRLVHTTSHKWLQWEAGEQRMHPAFWELFKAKAAASREAWIDATARSDRPTFRGD